MWNRQHTWWHILHKSRQIFSSYCASYFFDAVHPVHITLPLPFSFFERNKKKYGKVSVQSSPTSIPTEKSAVLLMIFFFNEITKWKQIKINKHSWMNRPQCDQYNAFRKYWRWVLNADCIVAFWFTCLKRCYINTEQVLASIYEVIWGWGATKTCIRLVLAQIKALVVPNNTL